VKLNELIAALEIYRDEFGNVPVYVVTGDGANLEVRAATDTDYDKYDDVEGWVVDIVASGESL
jgi:hypothetical protein